jgi:hypothetical protein
MAGIAGMEGPERPLAGSAIAVVLMDAVFSGVEDIFSKSGVVGCRSMGRCEIVR